jgi:hypothetical protein
VPLVYILAAARQRQEFTNQAPVMLNNLQLSISILCAAGRYGLSLIVGPLPVSFLDVQLQGLVV